MTWHNLPCAPTLHAIAAACPRGWTENRVTNCGELGAWAREPSRVWGIETLLRVDYLTEDMRHGKEFSDIPDGAIVLARVERAPLVCNTCGAGCDAETMFCETAKGEVDGEWVGCPGLPIVRDVLVTTWGEDGKPVYWTGEGAPDYSGQQAAPKPGRGDMWARLIERLEGLMYPRVIEMMRERRRLGIERYGTVLQAGNGRNVARDAMEETLDRMVYLEQLTAERPDYERMAREAIFKDLGTVQWLDSLAQEIDQRREAERP